MLSRDSIQAIIFQALNNINEERDSEELLKVGQDTRLFGDDSVLDSLSLVSLIVDVESAVSEQARCDISLTDDHAMSQEVSPFTDVISLTDYIESLLSDMT